MTAAFCSFKLQVHDEIYWLRFYSSSLIHILSLSNLHNNVASIQKNRGDISHSVIVALERFQESQPTNCNDLRWLKSEKKITEFGSQKISSFVIKKP